MHKPSIRLFFIATILLSPITGVEAEQLFEQNLLLSSKHALSSKEPPSIDPTAKWGDGIAQASEKARHGSLVEALNDLSKLIANHPEEVDLSKAFAERAEVKSLLGFTNSALEDCDQACMHAGSSKFLHLWHRWMILERAGMLVDAQRALQAADKEVHRQQTLEPSVYTSAIQQLAEEQRTKLLKADDGSSKKLLAAIKGLCERETPPSIEEVRDELNIPLEGTPSSSYGCIDCSGNRYWVDANASPDMTILHLRINADFCAVSKEDLSNVFGLEPDQNGASFVAKKRGKLQGLRFGFDAERVRFIGLYWNTPGLPAANSKLSGSRDSAK